MCGIAGVLGLAPRGPAAQLPEAETRALLSRMGSALAHRGPDGLGYHLDGPLGITHRRLAILDLSPGGAQPMSFGGGRYWITYNGEVYNYLELAEELRSAGVSFHGSSDTEVVLAAFARWGTDCFRRFNGMWGLGIWDAVERRLTLSRDRFGVKPLHLHVGPDRLLFASEVKAILAADPSLARLDRRSVARFLEKPALSFGPSTFFEGIQTLEPGTFLVIDAHGARRQERYWNFRPSTGARELSFQDATAGVRDLLVDSVRLRFRSDVPVGTCLSGGLDSSSIVSIAHSRLGRAPRSFSVLYDQPGYDEGQFVQIMEEACGLHGTHVRPDGRDVPQVLEAATYHQEWPTLGPGIYSQWHVMRGAGPHVRVLLDGQGSDEIFGGYHYHLMTAARGLARRLRAGDLAAVGELLQVDREVRELNGQNVLRTLVESELRPVVRRWGRAPVRTLRRATAAGVRAVPGGLSASRSLLRTLGLGRWAEKAVTGPVAPLMAPGLSHLLGDERGGWPTPQATDDELTNLLWDETVRLSIPGLLHYEDRDSMAFSIEARTPFLDYRLVEFAFGLPSEYKIKGGTTKRVLREAMMGILPEPIRARKDKKGYPTPFGAWIRDQHVDWLRELVLGRRAIERGFYDAGAATQLVDDHLAGQDNAWILFRLATLELFCRRFLDGPFLTNPPPVGAVMSGPEVAG